VVRGRQGIILMCCLLLLLTLFTLGLVLAEDDDPPETGDGANEESGLTILSVESKIGPYVIEHIAPRKPQLISLVFNISTSEPITSMRGDFSSLTQNPLEQPNQDDVSLSCIPYEHNETLEQLGVVCTATAIHVQRTTPTADVALFIEQSGETIELAHEITFVIDDQGPIISKIESDYCDGATCYVAAGLSTPIHIHVTDPVGTMHLNKLFYRVGSSTTRMVTFCQENVCRAFYAGYCDSNDRLQLDIVVGPNGQPSGDDAGNEVTGELSRSFVCDQFSPGEQSLPSPYHSLSAKESLSYVAQDGVFVNVKHTPIMVNPVKDETITLWALITEDVSGVDAYLNSSALNNDATLQRGSCQSIDDQVYNCTWAVTGLLPGEHTIYMEFADKAGHTSRFQTGQNEFSSQLSITMQVDDLVLAEDGPTPKFFKDITATPLASQGYNRIALQLAYDAGMDYPLYASFTLQRSGIGGDIEAIHTFIDNYDRLTCRIESVDSEKVAMLTPASFEFRFTDPRAGINEKNMLLVIINEDTNNLPDDFTLYCNVSVIVRQSQTKVYKEPSVFEIAIPLKLKNSALGATPGKAFADKIIEQEESLLKWNDVMELTGQILNVAYSTCKVVQQLALVESSGAAIETVGRGMEDSGILASAGTVLKKLGGGLFKFGSKSIGPAVGEKTFLGTACEFVTCTNDDLFTLLGQESGLFSDDGFFVDGGAVGEFVDDFSFGNEDSHWSIGIADDLYGDLTEDIRVPDSQNSIVGSVMNACLPGVFLNLDKYRTIQCEALICYKQSSLYGIDVATCDLGKASSVCSNVIGEVYEFFPYTRMWSGLMDNAAAMAETAVPTILISVLNNALCKGWEESPPPETNKFLSWTNLLLCKVTKATGDVLNQMEKSRGSFYMPPVQNHCQAALCNNADLRTCGYPTESYYDYGSQKPVYLYWDEEAHWGGPTDVPDNYRSKELAGIVDDYYGAADKYSTYYPDAKSWEDIADLWNPENPRYLNTGESNPAWDNKDLREDYTTYTENQKLLVNFLFEVTNEDSFKDALEDLNGDEFKNKLEAIPSGLKFTEDSIHAYLNSDVVPNAHASDFNEMMADPDSYFSNVKDDDDKKFKDWTDTEKEAYRAEQAKTWGYEEQYNYVTVEIPAQIKNIESQLNSLHQDVSPNLVQDYMAKNGMDVEYDYENARELLILELESEISSLENEQNTIRDPSLDPLIEADAKIRKQQTDYMVNFAINQALSFAAKQGWLNWMKSSYIFGTDSSLAQFADWARNSVDAHKKSVCDGGIFNSELASSVPSGSAMQCANELCRPVLTQAVERVGFDAVVDNTPKKLYLYTIVYQVGNVRPTSAIAADETIKFRVLFKTSKGTSESLHEPEIQELSYGEVNDLKISILSEEEYTQMCFLFDEKFPPGDGITRKKEYCRKIIISDSGATAFDTGVPVPSDYIANALAELNNPNSGSGQTGNSGINSDFTMDNYGNIVY